MYRSSINKKNLSNSRIYSDTVSLNLYNRPSNNNFDDTRSVCIKNNSFSRKNSNENLRLSNSRILSNLSISQTRSKNNSISKTQNKTMNTLKKSRSQTNLSQSLVKPPLKQVSKPVNSKLVNNTQQKPVFKQNNQRCLTSSKNTNIKPQNIPQKPQPTPKQAPVKIIPKIIQTTHHLL